MAVIKTRSGREISSPDEIPLILQDRTKIRDPIEIGSISMAKNPLGVLDINPDSLEKRLQTIRNFVPDDTESLYFDATDVYFAGVHLSQRVYFVSGSPCVINKNLKRTYPFVEAKLEPYKDASQLFYLEDALNLDEGYATQKELDKKWIPVYDPSGRQIGVLSPSYIQDFMDQDEAELPSSLRIKLKEDIRQAKGKPGTYKIKGKILGMQEDEFLGNIDKLFGRAADVSHEDIKFEVYYAKQRDFDVIPHVKKETGDKTQTSEKTVVIPASHGGFNKNYIYFPGAALVAAGIAIVAGLYYRGCDSRRGYKDGSAQREKADTEKTPSEGTEKTAEPAELKDTVAKTEDKTVINPESKTRGLEKTVKKEEKDQTKKRESVPGREARVRGAVKREPRVRTEERTLGGTTSSVSERKPKERASASEGEYTYLPPVREGDPFYEEFKDSIDNYLNDCVNSGMPETGGAFTYNYVTDIHGKVTRVVVSESNPRIPIPTRCAEGLREIMERQILETASDGIYTSTEIIELGGVE